MTRRVVVFEIDSVLIRFVIPSEFISSGYVLGGAPNCRKIDMCEQCERIDEQLLRYRFMTRWINDPQALRGLSDLIAQCEAKKRDLHPERQK